MARLDIRVQIAGSKASIYTVKLFQWDGKTKLRCDCQAGANGNFCKHRRAILNADASGFDFGIDGPKEWDAMQAALDETGMRTRLLDVEAQRLATEESIDRLKLDLVAAKKRLVELCEGAV